MARQPTPQPQQKPERDPAYVRSEGEAMLELAKTMQALVNSPAYGDATSPSLWKRLFG